jgi:subtilisin family serine protease
MRRANLIRFVALSVLLVLWPGKSPAKDHVVTVGNEQLRFVPQGEKGYVVKQPNRPAGISVLGGMLFLEEGQVRPIGGLDRHGIWIVENDGPASRNDAVMAVLIEDGAAEYVAPLFSSYGETVAIIPEIVIRVKPGIEMEEVQILCESAGCTIKKRMEFTTQEYLLEVLGPDAEAVFAAVEELGQAPEVEWACPNTAARLRLAGQTVSAGDRLYAQDPGQGTIAGSAASGVFPNDEYFPMQWHLHNTGQSGGTPGADINAPEAWEITTGDPNIVIAVIDEGVDTHHPDLVNNIVPGYDFVEDDNTADPAEQGGLLAAHGTGCAGLIAAEGNNGIGVTGVTWNCKIMPIRIFDAEGRTSDVDAASAFRWAAANGADVLSNSWGGAGSPSPIMHSAIVDVTQTGGIGREGKGCVLIFAAGNDNGPLKYPESYVEVIAIGATGRNDARREYSNYGPELDLMAPSEVWTTGQTGLGLGLLGYTDNHWGTSASCPIAAGVAALVLSVNPNLTSLEVQEILQLSARDLGDPGRDDYYGWGRVDAYEAVTLAHPTGVLFVDDNCPNDPAPGDPTVSDPLEDGSTEHPFDAIQEALIRAPRHGTIIISPGTYTGPANRNIDFRGRAITVRSADGPASCIIDCQGEGRGFYFHSGEGPGSVVEGLTIANGKADNGGAISCTDKSSPTINHCIFRGNSASLLGGAVYVVGSDVMLRNCTFSGNTAVYGGGAICQASGTMTVVNCILWGDSAPEISSFAERHVQYCDVQGSFTGEGNINADPLFADPASGDYHLKSQAGRWDVKAKSWVKDDVMSPCIDAGDPNSDWPAELWPHGKRIDMGAFGGTPEASMSLSTLGNIADLNNDNSVGHADLKMLVEKWLHQEALVAEDLDRNGVVNLSDFCILADEWLWQGS